ncbi:11246_t:CDS:2, partial [Acaulospora colombiana]
QIISGSADLSICIWNGETGEWIGSPFEGHTDTITSLVVSPDGKYLASGSHDKVIRIWDYDKMKNQQPSPPFSYNSKMVSGWILGPDSELLFWVPPELRHGLWRPNNVAVMGKSPGHFAKNNRALIPINNRFSLTSTLIATGAEFLEVASNKSTNPLIPMDKTYEHCHCVPANPVSYYEHELLLMKLSQLARKLNNQKEIYLLLVLFTARRTVSPKATPN